MFTFVSSNPSFQVVNHPFSSPCIRMWAFISLRSPLGSHKTEMASPSVQFPGCEGKQAASVSGPPDPPNTPVPRLMHSADAPDADQLELLLVEALDSVQTFDGPGDPARSLVSGSTNGLGERRALGHSA